MVYHSGKLGEHRSIYRIIPLDDASKWLLYSGFLGVPGNNGFSKGMFIYMYIHINSNSIFNQFCKCAIISRESANGR